MMSDVEIPVHVARAQVSAAVDLIVQLGRFSEDGSRRVTGISEVRGLDSAGQYELRPLYVCKMSGKSEAGRLIGDLAPTGERPTFASEPRELGMASRVQHSAALWDCT
jgi:pilus assembly protein CpaF